MSLPRPITQYVVVRFAPEPATDLALDAYGPFSLDDAKDFAEIKNYGPHEDGCCYTPVALVPTTKEPR